MPIFTTNDYSTLNELVAAQAGATELVEFQLLQNIAGGYITGFSSGLTITSSNDSSFTSNVDVFTSGLTTITNVKADNIYALSNANLLIESCDISGEVDNKFKDSAFLADGSTALNGVAYFDQIPVWGN